MYMEGQTTFLGGQANSWGGGGGGGGTPNPPPPPPRPPPKPPPPPEINPGTFVLTNFRSACQWHYYVIFALRLTLANASQPPKQLYKSVIL